MNTRILLLALSVAALSSCSSAYRSGQTPDDVYYSPARVQAPAADDEYVNVRQPKQGTNYQTYEQYQDNYRDDRFLRMSVGNPYYMNAYNMYGGFDWRYNSFYEGYNYGAYNPWNNYFAWNSFYNPYSMGFGSYYGGFYGIGYYGGAHYYGGGYYAGGAVKYTTMAPISRPVTFNVNNYSNANRAASRSYSPNTSSYYNNTQRYNNSNGSGNRSYYNNTNTGNNNRSSYTPSNNNNSYTPSRSYTPSSGGGGGGSVGGGGGGGAVSRPGRGN